MGKQFFVGWVLQQLRVELPPTFLAPTLASLSYCQSAAFSTSQGPLYARKRDLSRNRGVSAIHRSGPRWKMEASKETLPIPVTDMSLRKIQFVTDPKHGLWGFFNEQRTSLNRIEEDYAHGRAWAEAELRYKSWDDLHKLWWVCMKELNMLATQRMESKRVRTGYGHYERDLRMQTIRKTQRGIRSILRERFYAWEDARALWDAQPQQWDHFEEAKQQHTEELLMEEGRISEDLKNMVSDEKAQNNDLEVEAQHVAARKPT